MIEGVELCWKMLIELVRSRESRSDELFYKTLQPLYERITAIHKEYLATFSSLARSIRNGEMDEAGLREYLEQRQQNLAAERTLSRQLGRALSDDSCAPAVRDFGIAVVFYFSSPYQTASSAATTYFSSFLDRLDDEEYQRSDEPPSKEVILKRLETITRSTLPAKFSEVSNRYARLCIHSF